MEDSMHAGGEQERQRRLRQFNARLARGRGGFWQNGGLGYLVSLAVLALISCAVISVLSNLP